jgi:hypothetical protein
MNLRSTTFFFGLLLGMLWLFGLTVAHKKTAVDASYLMPMLQGNSDLVVDSVTIKRQVKDKQPEQFEFTKDKDDVWWLKVPGVQKSVKLEGFRVEQIIRQIKDARHSTEAGVTDDLTKYGLEQPATVVMLKGRIKAKNKDDDRDRKEQEWKFYIGRESADQLLVYVNSSERPKKVYAVVKSDIDSVLFKDPNHLRSRRLFEFSDIAAATIDLKEGAAEVELKKGDDAAWRFEKPAYGFADFEGPPAPKELPPGAKPPEGGVKGLLAAIGTMRVDSEDDFIALSDTKLSVYGLEEGKETMRVAVGTMKEKTEKDAKEPKKELVKEVLAVGLRTNEKGRDQVFARMLGDQGVFKLNVKLLEPIKDVLQRPGTLRSLDVMSVDTKKVDAVTVGQGGDNVTLLRPEGKPWELQVGSGKLQKANSQAIHALVDALQGKREIVKFYDGDDFKKLDAEMKAPVAVVALYVGGLADAKLGDAKDKDSAKDKKDETKDESPRLKKDAKAAVTLSFGASDKDTVNVQRVTADGTISRFAVAKSVLDKVMPGDLTLAFLDAALPEIAADALNRVVIAHEAEKIDIEKGWGDKANRWFFKEGQETPGKSPTDAAKTGLLVSSLTNLQAKKWLPGPGPKDDLEKYGLKKPSRTVTLYVKKDTPGATAVLVGVLATPSEWRGLLAGSAALAYRQTDPGETVVLKIGKETDQEKDKPAVYAQRSDKDLLFLLPSDYVRMLREVDLRDRTGVITAQPVVSAALLGLQVDPVNAFLASSPLATNQVLSFDAAKVRVLKLAIRTPDELRNLFFQRFADGKGWGDQAGLQEFNLDSQKVTQTLEQLATLKASRWVNLSGGIKSEQKLTPKEASLRIEMTLDDGKSITLTVGALFERLGYYAQTSVWPDAVFLLAPGQVEPYLHGPGHFAKERAARR